MFPRLRPCCKQTAATFTNSVPPPIPRSSSAFTSSARQNATAAPRTQPSQYKTRARPFVFVLGLMPIFTFGLGTWQIKRLQWKLDMIEQLENKLHKDPVRLPARIDPDAIPEFAYRKVYITGQYDYEHELEMGPKTRDGELGYHVVTPLHRGEGQDTIMVNRGFVKREKRPQSERPASLKNGPVEVVGMLRSQEEKNAFTPENRPDKGEWVFSNIDEMAKFTGAEPVLVDEILEGHAGEIGKRLNEGVPVGRPAQIVLRNQHMTYAVTWYALSLATAFMFFRLVRRPARASVQDLRNVTKG